MGKIFQNYSSLKPFKQTQLECYLYGDVPRSVYFLWFFLEIRYLECSLILFFMLIQDFQHCSTKFSNKANTLVYTKYTIQEITFYFDTDRGKLMIFAGI